MSDFPREGKHLETQGILAGDSEMARRMRALDWSKTPLGPVESWPQSLKSALSICLNTRFPIGIYWGIELVLLYNDAWSPIPGTKHPWALGRPAREAWPEIWHIIGPLFEQVMKTGEGSRSEDQLLPMHRHGYTEECYFDYTFSPIRGESGQVDGIFNAVTETTYRVLSERRARLLRELAERLSAARSVDEACSLAAQALQMGTADVPFALLYLTDPENQARLAASSGIEPGAPAAPRSIDLQKSLPWPLAEVLRTGTAKVVREIPTSVGVLPGGPWPEPTAEVILLPLEIGRANIVGFFVAGVSPRRALDESYLGFFQFAAGHIANAISNARTYEQERKRAEALAELDRAKTTFFSNVSHEFRTPLTLMLGPVEDILAKPEGKIPPENRELLTLVHRNGQRLLKLVNTLLDFSRIEAGRVEASYEPTDLAAFTAELASMFRSAVEKEGLRLIVDCPSLPEPVYVDREMWEKIVLNLLSNAFKFTFEGEIEVALHWADDHVDLKVRDTGAGIPAEELPRIFERFHRIQNTRSRTHEGTGIGLALVQELVKLHGGTIRVESDIGKGTTFFIEIPKGTAHLPAEKIKVGKMLASTAMGAKAFVEEASRWLANELGPLKGSSDPLSQGMVTESGRVLVADDNADMRDYLKSILSPHWSITAVADGAAALAAARHDLPDLVLADVMMPNLDGFGLLRELRGDPKISDVPIILLSARAGEESRVEGLVAGADDYLIKPFTARELIVRVNNHIRMTRMRKQAEEALRKSHEELHERAQELSSFNQVAVGRELRMIELKREVNELLRRLGEAERYPIEF